MWGLLLVGLDGIRGLMVGERSRVRDRVGGGDGWVGRGDRVCGGGGSGDHFRNVRGSVFLVMVSARWRSRS